MELVQAAEPDEGQLLLELSDAFWSQDPGIVYRAAAQIIFTMGNLEEGGAVTLIDGLGAGVVKTPDGEKLDQPLTRRDFDPPLVQIVQPVAGATVARTIPIDLSLARARPVKATLEIDGKTQATTTVHRGRGRLVAGEAPAGDASVEIEVDPRVRVSVPVTLAPRS